MFKMQTHMAVVAYGSLSQVTRTKLTEGHFKLSNWF